MCRQQTVTKNHIVYEERRGAFLVCLFVCLDRSYNARMDIFNLDSLSCRYNIQHASHDTQHKTEKRSLLFHYLSLSLSPSIF